MARAYKGLFGFKLITKFLPLLPLPTHTTRTLFFLSYIFVYEETTENQQFRNKTLLPPLPQNANINTKKFKCLCSVYSTRLALT